MSSDLIIPGKYINTIVMARLWQQKSNDRLECHSIASVDGGLSGHVGFVHPREADVATPKKARRLGGPDVTGQIYPGPAQPHQIPTASCSL
jgi:hypothetical protein